jgi:hypothetical protein
MGHINALATQTAPSALIEGKGLFPTVTNALGGWRTPLRTPASPGRWYDAYGIRVRPPPSAPKNSKCSLAIEAVDDVTVIDDEVRGIVERFGPNLLSKLAAKGGMRTASSSCLHWPR